MQNLTQIIQSTGQCTYKNMVETNSEVFKNYSKTSTNCETFFRLAPALELKLSDNRGTFSTFPFQGCTVGFVDRLTFSRWHVEALVQEKLY